MSLVGVWKNKVFVTLFSSRMSYPSVWYAIVLVEFLLGSRFHLNASFYIIFQICSTLLLLPIAYLSL